MDEHGQIEWYMNQIRHEVIFKGNGGFCGSVEFRLNFVNGGIVNMNVGTSRTMKHELKDLGVR